MKQLALHTIRTAPIAGTTVTQDIKQSVCDFNSSYKHNKCSLHNNNTNNNKIKYMLLTFQEIVFCHSFCAHNKKAPTLSYIKPFLRAITTATIENKQQTKVIEKTMGVTIVT